MRCPAILCLLVAGFATPVLYAQGPLPADGSFSAKGHVEYVADSSGRLTLAQVWRDSARFRPVASRRFALGVGQSPHWLRFRVSNATAVPMPFVVEIDNQFLTSVRLYALSVTGQLLRDSGPLGWSVRPADRSSNHRNPLLILRLPPGKQVWVYGRFGNPSQALRIPVRLWTAQAFERYDRQQRLFWYGLTGILSWLVFTNVVLFVLLRERVYGFYSLYMFLVTAYLTISAGFWLEWLPTTQYGLVNARQMLSVVTAVSTLAGFFFIKHYVLLTVWPKARIRMLFRVAVYLLTTALLLVLIGTRTEWFYIQQIRWLGPLMSLLFGLPVLLMFLLIGHQALPMKTGASPGLWQSPARLYLLGITPLVGVSVGLILRNHAIWADFGIFGYEGIAVGYLFEFAVLSVGLGFRYKRTADERHQLARQTADQWQQLLESQGKVQQEELRAVQAQLRLQEDRERISRDLHDHVGAQLSVIAAGETTSALGDYAREAIQSLRDTVWAIDQPELTMAEFGAKLRQYLNRQQQQHPGCVYTLDLEAPASRMLSSAQALNLFRQVQEAVHNAFKYAEASEVTVRCRVENNQLTLSVSDNGVGFELHQPINGELHYGLRNLQRRATELHGQCQIETAPGQGTNISVQIPLAV